MTTRIEILEKQILTDQENLKKILARKKLEGKAVGLVKNGNVKIFDDKVTFVKSSKSEEIYKVYNNFHSCSCKGHIAHGKNGIICCHRIADHLAREEYDKPKEVPVTFAEMEDLV